MYLFAQLFWSAVTTFMLEKETEGGEGVQIVELVRETYLRGAKLPFSCRLYDWRGLFDVRFPKKELFYSVWLYPNICVE